MWSREENALMYIVLGAIKGRLTPEHGATGSCETVSAGSQAQVRCRNGMHS